MRIPTRVALINLALAAVSAAGEERPFPVRRSINLRSGGIYAVLDRQKIPQSVEITCKRNIRIVGRGDDAILEVEGSLQVKGQPRHPVVIEDVWIEPSATFEEIRLMNVVFRGGGVRCPEGRTVRGRIIVENAEFDAATAFDVTLRGGEVNMLNATFRDPVRITGTPLPGKRCSLKVNIIGCYFKPRGPGPQRGYSGFLGGLLIKGARKAVVRDNRLAGRKSEFVDCATLTFDGNKVDSDELLFRQTRANGFGRTKLQKCDIYSRRVVLCAPRAKTKQRVPIDKCWFHGLRTPGEILARLLRDGHTDDTSGVYVVFRRIHTRPLGLAGSPPSERN